MQKKYVKFNVLIALALLFAICYQSLHIFTDEAHHFCDEVTQENTSKTHFSKGNHNDSSFHPRKARTSDLGILLIQGSNSPWFPHFEWTEGFGIFENRLNLRRNETGQKPKLNSDDSMRK